MAILQSYHLVFVILPYYIFTWPNFKIHIPLNITIIGRIISWSQTAINHCDTFNGKNKHYAQYNPYLTRKTRAQCRISVNIWYVILNDKILGYIRLDWMQFIIYIFCRIISKICWITFKNYNFALLFVKNLEEPCS